MTIRQLTTEEKTLCENAILNSTEQLDYLGYMKEYTTLVVEKGLYQNYQKQLKEAKSNLKELENQVDQYERKIIILRDQIDNGVEVKENNEVEIKIDGIDAGEEL